MITGLARWFLRDDTLAKKKHVCLGDREIKIPWERESGPF